ncbi:MAG: ATP-binding protein [Bacteroidota bacterium]
MISSAANNTPSLHLPEFLSGGGEMGQRIREFDWSKTSMGPVTSWPQNLRTCIRIMLASRQPIWIGWGKELIKFYNDPYKSIVGGKHPLALGMPASIVWEDIWQDIGPMLKQVMEKDEGTYVESQLLIMERNGYPEETYYTFSYTPIPGDQGETAGMICANTDDTERIISERQLKTLTQLGKVLTDATSVNEIIEKSIHTIQQNQQDFPFSLFYSVAKNQVILSHRSKLGEAEARVPHIIELDDENEIGKLFKQAAEQKTIQVLDDLQTKFGEMPTGAWKVSPGKAIILPILQTSSIEPYGFIMVGLNPFRLLDEKYRSFFSLVSDQISKSFVNIHLLEEERKTVEALAQIDRAKTIFFSNLSHEFRTPLTLLLGPISDVLNDTRTIPENRERLDVAYRNAIRMQKLVNTLLDFSRMEAGRVEGRFSLVDICTLTTDLASNFRSAVEKAGMHLQVDCGPVYDDIYVDTDMWEKIVLNLVSNAFKYSKKGNINVVLKQVNKQLIFSVSDNGIGIPEEQVEKIFDRFHRVENIYGRSQEGTGIGLAMVKELVKLHDGTVSVKSEYGKGSTFTVVIPVGHAHIEPGKIIKAPSNAGVSVQAISFVQEALKWIPSEQNDKRNSNALPTGKSANNTSVRKLLLADDNDDMRAYVTRLLSDQFEVITAVDGNDAYEKMLITPPDLLLSDVMMPGLDGFGLLKKIRAHNSLKNIPVIFLSARAGEEAKVEGLEAGADDYLVKPFTAKELIARIDGNIKIAKSRLVGETNLKNIIEQAPVAMAIFKGSSMILEMANKKIFDIWGKTREEVINKPVAEAFKLEMAQGFGDLLQQVYDTGESYFANEQPVHTIKNGKHETIILNFVFQAYRDSDDKVIGIIVVALDVTDQVLTKNIVQNKEKELSELADALPQLVWIAEPSGTVTYYNDRVSEFAGATKLPNGHWSWEGLVHPDERVLTAEAWKHSVKTGSIYQLEHRVQMKTGEYRWFLSRGIPQRDENGIITKWFGTATDIHVSKEYANILEQQVQERTSELKELNISLQHSNDDLQQFAHVASHDLKEPLRKIKTFSGRLMDDGESILSERGLTYLAKMNSATERLFSMIEGVLNYSTLNASEQKNQIIRLEEILQHIETDLELLILQKNATIHYSNFPPIEGASVLIYQLFYNLLNNGLKFSGSERAPVISVTSKTINKNDKKFIEITIADNGIGFDNEHAEKIFDPFARLNSKDKYEGTGLGLSLCKKIVQRHGGTITANSIKNIGSSFIVILPMNQGS